MTDDCGRQRIDPHDGPLLSKHALIVELDDASHKQRRRQERDAFLDRVCTDAGLPILHQPAQIAYDTKELRQSVIDSIAVSHTERQTLRQKGGDTNGDSLSQA